MSVNHRRCTAAGVVAAMSSALVLATASTPAGATPVATAVFSSNATSSIVALHNVTLGARNLATATVGPATASIANASSTARAANLVAAIVNPSPIAVNFISRTAPPPGAPFTSTLVSVPLPPVLSATALSGTVHATWPSATTCPAAGVPVADASVTTAAATVVGGIGNTALSLASLSAATTRSTTSLVTEPGLFDTRGVQASATNNIATVDLLGGATGVGTGITIDINTAPVLTGTATGVVGTSSVVFTPATATVSVAGVAAGALTPDVAFPIAITVGGLAITGSITLNGSATTTNTGTAVSGDASLLSLTLDASTTVGGVSVARSTSLDVAPLHVEATAPTTGIQCAPIPVPTATGINPNQGPTTGGTTVTITGTGFVPGQTSVTICGIVIPVTAVTVVNGTTLTFVTPPHAAGPCDVTVTTPGGTTGPLTFTYIPVPPVITSPGNGDTTSGTPPIVGTGTAGDTVTVSEGATVICTAVVDANGNWSCTPTSPLACGSNTIPATQESPNGLVSGASNEVTFTVDCTVLAATGAPTRGLLSLGLMLVVLGGLMLAAARRRRTA
jgi:large repetitive protein